MDDLARDTITMFLAQYDTLAIATEHDGQPFVTRAFFVEEPVHESRLRLYGTFITTSRKLANLQQNPRVGIFIGPSQPTTWLEATALARTLNDEDTSSIILANLAKKSSVAATFIARVPVVAVEMQITWLRITNVSASPRYIEVTFSSTSHEQGERF
ncbi:MAG TPA: pyridoxamine 5'-phosphate oxidase family protein [Ktedonobacteraceae bacterium]|nr:pyridoxamine 5'-phosphate oxidase family protein [Ktedonobacteraceae bacterium]